MASYYPQPSRPSWADMSKNERKASGMTKKEYNRKGENVIFPQPSPGMPPRAPEPRPFPGRGGDPVARPQPFPMPPSGSREPIARPQPYPMPGGDDVKGTPNKTKKAQDFKDRYTGKVEKAVSKRKSETIAERRERRKRRNRK